MGNPLGRSLEHSWSREKKRMREIERDKKGEGGREKGKKLNVGKAGKEGAQST